MRNPTQGMHPLLRGVFGLVTAGLMVIIGATVYGDGTGKGRWIAYAFFALAAYRAFEAIREAAQGLRSDDDDADEGASEPDGAEPPAA